MTLSRFFALLSLLGTIAATAATLLQIIRPQWAAYALAITAAINAFTERVQGGKSKLEAEQELGFNLPPKE